MIRLAVAGATGRTGQAVVEVARRDDRFDLAAALTAPGCPTIGSDIQFGDKSVTVSDTLEAECDVLIDFTSASGTVAWLEACEARKVPMVIGATGHDETQLARIVEAADLIPIVPSAARASRRNAALSVATFSASSNCCR